MKSLRMFLWMMLITGFAYPLLVTGIAQVTMKHKANGSIVEYKGKAVGSKFIAQPFKNDSYFWPRPSAVDYNTLSSGGSNLGPISAELKKTVQERKAAIIKAHNSDENAIIPSELLYASGSGLDPQISPTTAFFQIERIAKSRKLNDSQKQDLRMLISENTHRTLGIFGPGCVNVLELNLALDELKQKP